HRHLLVHVLATKLESAVVAKKVDVRCRAGDQVVERKQLPARFEQRRTEMGTAESGTAGHYCAEVNCGPSPGSRCRARASCRARRCCARRPAPACSSSA